MTEKLQTPETPMVVETSKRVKKLIDKLYEEKHIDEMTRRWLSLTPNPPRRNTKILHSHKDSQTNTSWKDRSSRAAKALRKESHHRRTGKILLGGGGGGAEHNLAE